MVAFSFPRLNMAVNSAPPCAVAFGFSRSGTQENSNYFDFMTARNFSQAPIFKKHQRLECAPEVAERAHGRIDATPPVKTAARQFLRFDFQYLAYAICKPSPVSASLARLDLQLLRSLSLYTWRRERNECGQFDVVVELREKRKPQRKTHNGKPTMDKPALMVVL